MLDMSSSPGSILVTGANGGLGSAVVAHVLKTSNLASTYTGIYTVRKAATANTLNAILNKAPNTHRHETLELDLGSLESVRVAAVKINKKIKAGEMPPIRALILNAGYQDLLDIVSHCLLQ